MTEEVIRITGSTETVDNWGRVEQHDEQETFRILSDPDYWTDDIIFRSEAGRDYLIDDLIGKKVRVGSVFFTVQEN